MSNPGPAAVAASSAPLAPSALLLRACRGESLVRPPVWFMRQAGRALPEYRLRREGIGMLDACRDADVVVDVTLQPVDRYDVDAAILFSDIVVPIHAVGVELDIVPGVGPVVAKPITAAADLDALRALEPEDVAPVTDAVRELVRRLDVPLIGFAGAPFTVASYLIEGGPSRQHLKTKAMMYSAPDLWAALMDRLVAITGAFLRLQIDAGVSVVQLFDSWAGTLSEDDYRRYVMPHSAAVLASVADVPRIHFGVGTAELLSAMGEAGADVVGVDWRTPLDRAVARVGGRAVQGNLDPALVATAPWEVVAAAVDDVVDRGRSAAGHIFNLGHGVLPETDPDVLTRVVARLHELDG